MGRLVRLVAGVNAQQGAAIGVRRVEVTERTLLVVAALRPALVAEIAVVDLLRPLADGIVSRIIAAWHRYFVR